MITKNDRVSYRPKNSLEEKYFTKDSIFFDIETTGFSPVKNTLYLIGCGYRDEENFHIVQFFAENKEEQADVLTAFFSLISGFKTILSFNGLGFDLPFLKAKCASLQMEDPFSGFDYIDIFKSVSKYKKILNLENYKQKTLEKFLGIDRDDTYNGGELISVYQSYEKQPSTEALHLLLLHNHDDVLGILPLIQLMAYEEFFTGNYTVSNATLHPFTDFEQQPALELLISGTTTHPFPAKVSVRKDELFLRLAEHQFSLSVPVFSGTLKYFYPDYKNYYYLPNEDLAIHKSVATYVEKEFRTPAKASTCYTKKEGHFLPQFEELFSPSFLAEYRSKQRFFLYEDGKTLQDRKNLQCYINHLLTHFCH